MCQRDSRQVPSISVGNGGEKGMLKETKTTTSYAQGIFTHVNTQLDAWASTAGFGRWTDKQNMKRDAGR